MSTLKQDLFHSVIEFKIKHLMISNVKGRFNSYDITFIRDSEDFTKSVIFCSIDVSSIDTGITERDVHLLSQDFFYSKKFPFMHFRSSEIIKKDNNEYKVKGSLIIKDESRPVTLDVTFNGSDVDGNGVVKFGYDINGVIKKIRLGS